MSAQFVWFDLAVDDNGVPARAFYARLFGWTIDPGMGDYTGWATDGGQPWAGIVPAQQRLAGRWIPYVVVDDLDTAAKQAVELGGEVVRDRKVGPAGASVIVADPAGALVALFVPAAPA